MKIEVKRIYKGKDYTIGHLYVDGVFFCDTLEPTDRGLTSAMTPWEISCRKVKGKTAIPTGTYFIDMKTVSDRFKGRKWAKAHGGRVPRLQGVKGFSAVLMHVGNSEHDTEGCILVGWNKAKGKVLNSTEAYMRLFDMMDKASEHITITIR